MRKQTKLVAVLSAASLLAIGASMTAFAATPHWDQEDGEWVYLDRNGDKVAGEWKKSNGQWYYLDDNGYMAKDLLIEYNDNRYYVDANGVKVTNAWVSMDNDDYLDDEDVSTVWFYFDGNGKAVGYGSNEGKIKKVSYAGGNASGYFIFNSDGVMLSGWQKWGDDENLYYLGDENEGWARTGWQYLDTDEEIFDEGDDNGDPYEEEEWFYFDSKGKAYVGNKQIGGRWYAFDKNGVMLEKWVYGLGTNTSASNGSSSTMADSATPGEAARYHEEGNGWRGKNWVLAYAQNGADSYDADLYWFYLDSKGNPVLADDENSGKGVDYSDNINGTDRVVTAKSIKNKTYIFDDGGCMRTGLFYLDGVKKGSNKMNEGYYYFTEEEGSTEGQMIANKKVTIDLDGEEETFYFDRTGKAYTNTVISGSLYSSNGALVTDFGDGSSYQMVKISQILDDKYFTEKGKSTEYWDAYVLINGNGKIKKSGTVTDVDGYKVTVKDYIVTRKEDEDKNPVYEADVKEGTYTKEDGTTVTWKYAVEK